MNKQHYLKKGRSPHYLFSSTSSFNEGTNSILYPSCWDGLFDKIKGVEKKGKWTVYFPIPVLKKVKYFDTFLDFCKDLTLKVEITETYGRISGNPTFIRLAIKVARTLGPYVDIYSSKVKRGITNPDLINTYKVFQMIMKAYLAGVDPYNSIILGFQIKSFGHSTYDPMCRLPHYSLKQSKKYSFSQKKTSPNIVVPSITKRQFNRRLNILTNIKDSHYPDYKSIQNIRSYFSQLLGVTFNKTLLKEALAQHKEKEKQFPKCSIWNKYRIFPSYYLPERKYKPKTNLPHLQLLIKENKWQEAYNYIGGQETLTSRLTN